MADFLEALSTDDATAEQALARVAAGWRDGQAALIVDMARLLAPSRRGRASAGREPAVALDTGGGGGRSGHVGLPREAGAGPVAVVEPPVAADPASARVRQRLVRFLAERTGQPFGDDLAAWRRWYWNQPYDPHPATRRSRRCSTARSMRGWPTSSATRPTPASASTRSTLLYRSNKLMYDAETRSLWSTTQGRPVLGPLAQAGPELAALPLVTTTWGEWKRMHPATRVLSRDTGHRRDYAEGAAYREYFASDSLMFAVPRQDPRLRNKDMVLALLDRDATGAAVPIAIARSRLRREAVLRVEAPGGGLLVLTTPGGASRVFRSGDRAFGRTIPPDRIADATGAIFRVTEEAFVPEADGPPLPRVAAREAFWFGWFAQHPDTRLVE